MYKIESENKALNQTEFNTFGLHIPDIMPDELYDGYFERFIFCNGFENAESAKKFLKENVKKQYPDLKFFTTLWFFAQIFKTNVSTFMHQHTLMPLARSFLFPPKAYPTEEEYVYRTFQRNAVPSVSGYYCICRKCVLEDISYWGFSYWRRSHALPGMELCLKHNSNLEAAKERDAYQKTPLYFVKNNLTYEIEECAVFNQNPFLQRYAQLLSDFFDLDFPLDINLTKSVINEKLTSITNPTNEFNIYQDIHKIMNKELPSKWIEKYFPALINTGNYRGSKSEGYFINILYGTTFGRTLINHLLMLAVIFEDTDEALIKLKIAHLSSPSTIKFPTTALN